MKGPAGRVNTVELRDIVLAIETEGPIALALVPDGGAAIAATGGVMIGAGLVVKVLAGAMLVHRKMEDIAIERIDLLGRRQIHFNCGDPTQITHLAAHRKLMRDDLRRREWLVDRERGPATSSVTSAVG